MMTKKTPVIMKHPKLYTKNEKGRYEEYQFPIWMYPKPFSEGLMESMFLYP